MDTVAKRWARLEPHVRAYGPSDEVERPAVLLFHGCGGVRAHMPAYAEAAAAAGWRAFVVDSYAPRGWGRATALSLVCTGLLLRGAERAGDVLAALWGVTRRPDVHPGRVVLAGWSHGGWSIMDLMTMPLTRREEAGLADPQSVETSLVRGAVLIYPYIGPPALSRTRPWVRAPKTLAVVAEQDHLASPASAQRLYARLQAAGAPIDVWTVPGAHAFDEPGAVAPMRYDPELARRSHARFTAFLNETL